MSTRIVNMKLAGSDDMAEVFFRENRIIRIYNERSSNHGKIIYDTLQSIGFTSLGVVETSLRQTKDVLELEHEQLFFANPENWTTTQFLHVNQFCLNLNSKLISHGLILKDMLPENILFKYSNTIFVDFASIVTLENLETLDWLMEIRSSNSPRRFVLNSMFLKFMFIPLHIGILNGHASLEPILRERYCNSGKIAPKLLDIKIHKFRKIMHFAIYAKFFWKLLSFKLIKDPDKLELKVIQYLQWLETSRPHDNSAYSSYYSEKGEKFDLRSHEEWGPKQVNFNKALDHYKPANLLDIGSNTGWFSILASSRGIDVTAIEVDEPSLDLLYRFTRSEKLPITCCLATFQDIISSKVPIIDQVGGTRNFPESRFDHEGVIAFGLIHHLCLGQGLSLGEIMTTLAMISRTFLIVEFIDLNDEKIASEQSFFPKYFEMSSCYSKEVFMNEAKKLFKFIVQVDSQPDTRSLFILSNVSSFL